MELIRINLKTAVFWDVVLYSMVEIYVCSRELSTSIIYVKDCGSSFHWNIIKYQPECMVSHSTRWLLYRHPCNNLSIEGKNLYEV